MHRNLNQGINKNSTRYKHCKNPLCEMLVYKNRRYCKLCARAYEMGYEKGYNHKTKKSIENEQKNL